MIEIQDNKPSIKKITSLNDIPIGQVFRGRVWGVESKRWTTGVFYKATGSYASVMNPNDRGDVTVVRLDKSGLVDGYVGLWSKCGAVEAYEPLRALITFEPMA